MLIIKDRRQIARNSIHMLHSPSVSISCKEKRTQSNCLTHKIYVVLSDELRKICRRSQRVLKFSKQCAHSTIEITFNSKIICSTVPLQLFWKRLLIYNSNLWFPDNAETSEVSKSLFEKFSHCANSISLKTVVKIQFLLILINMILRVCFKVHSPKGGMKCMAELKGMYFFVRTTQLWKSESFDTYFSTFLTLFDGQPCWSPMNDFHRYLIHAMPSS